MKRFSKTEVIIIGAILFVVGIAAKKVWISFFIGLPMIIISAVSILRNRKETENADKTSAESLEEPYKEPDIKNETVYEEAPADTKSDNNNSVKKEVVLMPKSDAIPLLRNKIIDKIGKTPSVTYELASLLLDDAARCFPVKASFCWDGAWFKLNLQTKKIFADVGTYPNQFGASRSDTFSLTAAEFNEKAKEFEMAGELQAMETEEDWQALFDEELENAIKNAKTILDEEKEKQKQAERAKYAIVIQDITEGTKPEMKYDKIVLRLNQRYGSSNVLLEKESDKYVLEYQRFATTLTGVENHKRVLSSEEAVWLERQVDNCIDSNDLSTWQSLPGGDRMSVEIYKNNTLETELNNVAPMNKYTDLKNLLENLAEYGSISKNEARF